MTKLIIAFRSFANAPKKEKKNGWLLKSCLILFSFYTFVCRLTFSRSNVLGRHHGGSKLGIARAISLKGTVTGTYRRETAITTVIWSLLFRSDAVTAISAIRPFTAVVITSMMTHIQTANWCILYTYMSAYKQVCHWMAVHLSIYIKRCFTKVKGKAICPFDSWSTTPWGRMEEWSIWRWVVSRTPQPFCPREEPPITAGYEVGLSLQPMWPLWGVLAMEYYSDLESFSSRTLSIG
jgi:hypothetical protein